MFQFKTYRFKVRDDFLSAASEEVLRGYIEDLTHLALRKDRLEGQQDMIKVYIGEPSGHGMMEVVSMVRFSGGVKLSIQEESIPLEYLYAPNGMIIE